MKTLNICPSTLKDGFNTYSPVAVKALFDGVQVSHIFPGLSPEDEAGRSSEPIKNIGRISLSGAQPKVSVIIGDESPLLKEHGLSMVVSDYSLGSDYKGKMAIIGPTRMDYAKVISTLNYMSGYLKGLANPDDSDENQK